MTRMKIPADLLDAYRRVGQDHVFRFWDAIGDEDGLLLLEQLKTLDLLQIRNLATGKGVVSESGRTGQRRPAAVVKLGEEPTLATRKEAFAAGETLIAQGKVGLFLVAGGQGSRLGFEGPKGCLPVGPLSQKTLFQLHAEKISALASRYRVTIPWFIMTSDANHEPTRTFFDEHRYFGLPKESVHFFQQAMLPAVDSSGKLILESKARLFMSPNGHGGSYAAFHKSGCLEEAERRGVEHLFYFQVDNVLIRIADPLFLGLHALAKAEMSLKLLRKAGPYEKLGVVMVEGDRYKVVEYSDLSREEAERRDAGGDLVFWAGSIAIHAFHLPFFRRVAEGAVELPYHVAKKKIPTVDAGGLSTQVEGRKFEAFVFDALPCASNVLNLEVRREEEFAPIKNKTGVDSLESAQALLVREHARWMREAGAPVGGRVEVSPLVALGAEDLRARLPSAARRAYAGDVRVEAGPGGEVVVKTVGP